MGTGWRRWLFPGALLAVAAFAVGVRIVNGDRVVTEGDRVVTEGDRVVTEGEIIFRDNDTARRLVRLEHLVDPDKPYPYRNPDDGYPDGTVIHWTLPMDVALIALDPLVSWAYPQARRFEAAAIWVNVVLGAFAIMAFALLAFRWLGPPRGLLATAIYSLTYPVVAITAYGNGDHQGLQHLCAVLVLLGFARLVWGQGNTRNSLMIGTALGLGLWISTETTVILQLLALGALLHLRLLPGPERPDAASLHLTWAGACLIIAFIGDRFEHPGQLFTFEWDKVSGFQLYQVLVLAFFLGLVRASWRKGLERFRNPLLSASVALAIGILVLLITPLGAATGQQLDLFRGANLWTQASINEYRGLFFRYGDFYPILAIHQLSVLVFLIPAFVVGCIRDRGVAASGRMPVLAVTVGLFALTCFEIKLGHLFAILYPWLIIAGGAWFLDRLNAPRIWRVISGCAALGCVMTVPAPQPEVDDEQSEIHEVIHQLRTLVEANDPEDEMRSVLATWDLGAMLMYYGRVPVVASGYHRNLSGIRDSLIALVSRNWDETWPILRARRVRWIVSSAKVTYLTEAQEILTGRPILVDIIGSEWAGDGRITLNLRNRPIATETLQWFLSFWRPGIDREDPGLRLVWESPGKEVVFDPRNPTPHYRIWRVVYPEERR